MSPERFAFWLANESLCDSSTPAETALPPGIDSIPAQRVHQISPESDWLSELKSLTTSSKQEAPSAARPPGQQGGVVHPGLYGFGRQKGEYDESVFGFQ